MMQSEQILERFKQLYNTLDRDSLTFELLNAVYGDDIQFEDCFHNIKGIESLFEYFDNLYENVNYIHFDFENHWVLLRAPVNSILNTARLFVIAIILMVAPCCMNTFLY